MRLATLARTTRRVARTVTALLALAAVRSLGGQTAAPATQPELFEILPFHSQVEFAVPFMGLATVKGSFEEYAGALLLDAERPERSSVTLVIQAASVHTGNATRDRHLRSSDFLDVERYPVIVFQSERVERAPAGGYLVRGTLTLHGVARAIEIPLRERHPIVRDPDGVDYAGYDGRVELDWRAFGIRATNANNPWFQPARMLVSDSVAVTLGIDATRRRPGRMHYPALDAALALVDSGGVRVVAARLAAARAQSPDSAARAASRLLDVAGALLERGRASDAVELYRLVADALPASADARAALAYGLLAAGRRSAAADAYRAALALDPHQPQALEMLRHLSP